MGGPHLTLEQKKFAFQLRSEGILLTEIARQVNCDQSAVSLILRFKRPRDGKPDTWVPRSGRLHVGEREMILRALARDESLSAIARSLGR